MGRLKLTSFRVTNFKNVEDSGPVSLENVTCFVGRNESGKTTLLKALHKFNPAIEEPYIPQREFPRDRFTKDFKDNGAKWPVCAVDFELSSELRTELNAKLSVEIPKKATFTRFYDQSLQVSYDTTVSDDPVPASAAVKALDKLASAARRLESTNAEQEEKVTKRRNDLLKWVATRKEEFAALLDLKNPNGVERLRALRNDADDQSNAHTADAIEKLNAELDTLIAKAEVQPIPEQLRGLLEAELPVFIYFENYGILDSAIYLPRFVEEVGRSPNDAQIRTINAMFKHVQLTAKDILKLGQEEAAAVRVRGEHVPDEMIMRDQQRKELRSVKLNSASLDISGRFANWFGQRRHQIRYEADGDYFRIWIADERRPDVFIELESRSKGFQWFFSFYLVFLVESEEGHRDAVLLLDEPGLHLHPTAQQGLLSFFDKLSEKNQLIYTTHSPFLIDGQHIERVRPVTEGDDGRSRVNEGEWPKDRDTIFPLQAAAGYAMVRGLFANRDNVLLEGMADYLYLTTLSLLCSADGRAALSEKVYLTPCGGTKLVGHLASLFLGQEVRPLVLLDGDDAGRVRRDALMKELYKGHERAVLLLNEVFGGGDFEMEDVVGADAIMPILNLIIGSNLDISGETDGTLVDKIERTAKRSGTVLPDGWKSEVARRVASKWAITPPDALPSGVLDRAERLISAINERFPVSVK
jgi:predicted ATP-dependent endonuclease of OLD family